jgi:hypothetical protein
MAIATLSVDLKAGLAGFEADMRKAARTSQETADKMASAFGIARAGLGGLVAGLAAGVSVSALTSFFRATVNGLDALNDLKDATGASIENLSALEDAAARTGTSFDGVAGTLLKFTKTLNEARPGSDVSQLLKSIGQDAEELKRIDPAQALQRVAKALALFSDDNNKAQFFREFFGKTIREAAPLMNDLAKSGELVPKVLTEQAEAAEKFNQQLAALKKNSEDAARAWVSVFLPALNKRLEAGNKEGFSHSSASTKIFLTRRSWPMPRPRSPSSIRSCASSGPTKKVALAISGTSTTRSPTRSRD